MKFKGCGILLIALGVIGLMSCENDIEKINLVANKKSLAAESAKDIEIVYSDSAQVRIIIKAPKMEHFINQNPYIEMAKGVNVVFYKTNMVVQNRLTANYAIKYEQKRLMEAKGNVVVVNEKGDQLNTEHLFWDEVTQMIYSKEFVKITTADEIIYGNGFEANQNFSKYKIFNIKGMISLSQKK
jgi:LPS export ABC transporter protein LptC